MKFLTNLQKRSVDFYENTNFSAEGWLLSSHRATPATLKRALKVRYQGCDLMADNGTIVYIRETGNTFALEAAEIKKQYNVLKRSLQNGRRIPYSTEVPDALQKQARILAGKIHKHVDEIHSGIESKTQTDIQYAMHPTHVIAKEDWAISVALGMGLERELLGWSPSRYVTRARKSLRGWKEVTKHDLATNDSKIFVTLAASDYITAKAVAKEAAAWGAEHIALGFAGLNATPAYSDVTYYPRRQKLRQPGPRRYVRLAEIAMGFRDGYRESSTTLQSFHALGLGARAMWPIVVAGLDWWTDISVDATSAIKDAEGRSPVIYNPSNAAIRIPITKLAKSYIESGKTPHDSPVLAYGIENIPCDLAGARKFIDQGNEVSHNNLRSNKPLGKYLPLFANGAGSSRAGVMMSHHNYWATNKFASSIPSRGSRTWALSMLKQFVDNKQVSVTVKNGCRAALEILR